MVPGSWFLAESAIPPLYQRSVDQAVPHRKTNELVDTVEIQLFHNPAAMRIHGVDAEIQDAGNLLIGLALGEHLQHLALPAGEQVDRIGNVPPVVVEDGVGDRGADI